MTERWITLDVERVHYVDRGRDVILCDRNQPGRITLVMKVTREAMEETIADYRDGQCTREEK